MSDYSLSIYEYFINLFKNELRNVFYPIKRYFKKLADKKNKNYAFFKKYDIMIKISNKKITITNFQREFNFSFYFKDIKKIRLYYTKTKFKVFWTCGTEFTKYFFKNYLKARVCIKDDESYNSIDLNNINNLQKDSFYLFPEKKFNFENNINSFLNFDLEDPPNELNFMIEKGKYCSKYKMIDIEFENEKSETFFHNPKTGVSLSLIETIRDYYTSTRVFYFNCNYIFISKEKERKKYFLYFLSFLFTYEESDIAKNFLAKIYYEFNKYKNNLFLLFEEIISFCGESKKLLIIFDNIHSKEQYSFVTKIKKDNNLITKMNIFTREFIQINKGTLTLLQSFINLKRTDLLKTIGRCKNNTIYDDLNIVAGLQKNNKDYLVQYNNNLKNTLFKLFEDYSINKYLQLIKLLYYLYTDEISKDILTNINFLEEIKEFIEFLYITIKENKIKIKFRNKIIEYYFNNYYNFYYNIFLFKQSKKLLKQMLGAEGGCSFERQIIFSLLIGSMKDDCFKVDINRIYCFEKIKKFNFDKNILFCQIIPNAPLYDFAVLIKNNEGKYILKVYQVTINKPIENLEKLYLVKIIYDLSYFIEKICRIFNIKIEAFSFGIITSLQHFMTDDKNILVMIDFCQKNNYEYLLYNIYKNEFSLYKKDTKESFIKIQSFECINSLLFKPMKIFKNDCIIYKKFYIEKINISRDEKLIKKQFFLLTKKEINIKLVGKFKCDISVFNQNEKLIFLYKLNNCKCIYIYYNDYKIYKKEKVGINKGKTNQEEKKEILVFYIENYDILKNFDFPNEKMEFKINEVDKEINIDYLISEEKEEILNFYDEAENIYQEIQEEEIENESITEVVKENQMDSSEEKSVKKEIINEPKEGDKNNNYSINFENTIKMIKGINSKKNWIDFDSDEFKIYPISKDEYQNLSSRKQDSYEALITKISNTKRKNNSDKNKIFLGKKRKK